MDSPANPTRIRNTDTKTIENALRDRLCTLDKALLKSPGAYYRLQQQQLLEELSSAERLNRFARHLNQANRSSEPSGSNPKLARWIRRILPQYAAYGDDQLLPLIEAHQITARAALHTAALKGKAGKANKGHKV